MESRFGFKKIVLVAGPIILGHLAENIINVSDTIFVGRLGEKPLGAVGLGGLYYYTFVLLMTGLALGVQILTGRRNGEKSYHEIGRILDNAVITFAGIGVFLFIAFRIITPLLMQKLVKSDDIYKLAVSFVNIRSIGLLFIGLTAIFRCFYIGITHTRIIIYITTGAALANIFFNQVLIFGHLGFAPMGIRGSATASVIADIFSLTGYVLYTIMRKENLKFNLFRFKKPDWQTTRSFLSLGLPIMLQSWISVSSWFVFFLFIEKMGERALSISTIIKNLYILMMIPVWGFQSSANTLVSNAMGAERPFEVMPVARKVLGISFVFMFILVQISLWFPTTVLGLFNSNPDLIAETIAPLRIICAALLIYSVGGVLFNTVSGTGSTRISLYIEIITLTLYMTYIVTCGTFFAKTVSWLWVSEVVYMSCMLVLSFLYLRTGRWRFVKI